MTGTALTYSSFFPAGSIHWRSDSASIWRCRNWCTVTARRVDVCPNCGGTPIRVPVSYAALQLAELVRTAVTVRAPELHIGVDHDDGQIGWLAGCHGVGKGNGVRLMSVTRVAEVGATILEIEGFADAVDVEGVVVASIRITARRCEARRR